MFKSLFAVCIICLFMLGNTQSQEVKKLEIGDSFPLIEGELLSNKKIKLPHHCKGKISVLIVAFKRGSQPQIDTWTQPLLQKFGMHDDFRFIEIPMISGFYSWMENYINNGMRKGIVKPKHKNIMTYFGPLKSYYKQFEVKDNKLCYLFLLNRQGKIQYMCKGEANEKDLKVLIDKTRDLLQN